MHPRASVLAPLLLVGISLAAAVWFDFPTPAAALWFLCQFATCSTVVYTAIHKGSPPWLNHVAWATLIVLAITAPKPVLVEPQEATHRVEVLVGLGMHVAQSAKIHLASALSRNR